MGTKIINKQFVAFLIEEYKALPSLWDSDSEAYKNKHIKKADYTSLLKTMRTVDPLLTMDALKKKIAKIRTCYRRDLKKLTESIKSGATGDDVFVPTLWYFHQMDFIRGKAQDSKLQEIEEFLIDGGTNGSNNEYEDHNFDGQCNGKGDEEEWKHVPQELKIEPQMSKQFKTSYGQRNTILNQPTKRPAVFEQNNQNNNKDEAALFSETWAVLYRKLSHEQQLYAKRCIDEILYQGQFGNLNSSTYRNIESDNNSNQ
ncbi:uncharacterized protein LOC129951134 [Eupeodes corollae]|uniref:uncharacterized protein LOC129951134 n=1 Tax=Eupeodes corollae TaxID=290404 RepID=UPI00249099CF|nr:uncharacterized protein LOC129951134 [Eupeodes corollae]